MLTMVDRQSRTISLPCGDGKESFLDPRDIAGCAVKLLTTPGHDGRIYEITGTEALTYTQVAEKLSAATGKKVAYQNIPEEALLKGFLSMGVHPPAAHSFIAMFVAVRNGKVYPPTSAVADLLGRPPRSFDDWVRDHAPAFQ
jgi:uncharacterized protein YbjT (DUF2867 family)